MPMSLDVHPLLLSYDPFRETARIYRQDLQPKPRIILRSLPRSNASHFNDIHVASASSIDN